MRDRLRQAVSEAILDAAEAVAAERGLHGAGVAVIAARAGVAVGTVYNHFEDRDNLIRALFRARRAVIAPAITAIAEARSAGAFEVRLRGFIGDVMALLERHRRFIKVSLAAEHLKAEQGGRAVMTAMLGAARAILAAGAAEGALDAADVDRLARLLLGGMRGLLVYRLDAGGAFTEDAELLVHVFLRGAWSR